MRATSLGVRRIAAGAPGNHSYYSFSMEFKVLYSVCILIHVSLYLYIYVSINLHRVYLNGLQAVLEHNRRYHWKQRSSKFGDSLGSRDGANLEVVFE